MYADQRKHFVQKYFLLERSYNGYIRSLIIVEHGHGFTVSQFSHSIVEVEIDALGSIAI